MLVGGIGLALVVLSSTDFGKKFIEQIKNFFKKKETTPTDIPMHDLVETILKRCVADGDEAGVQLISTFGKHLYDRELEKLSPKVVGRKRSG